MSSLVPRKYYLDSLFDNLLSDDGENEIDEMKCDIYEKDGKYYVEADLPGFKKEDIKIECNEGYLTITAEKSVKEDEHSKKYITQERFYSKFQRAIYVGDVQSSLVKAGFKDGILKIELPKEEEKPKENKYIDIE